MTKMELINEVRKLRREVALLEAELARARDNYGETTSIFRPVDVPPWGSYPGHAKAAEGMVPNA